MQTNCLQFHCLELAERNLRSKFALTFNSSSHFTLSHLQGKIEKQVEAVVKRHPVNIDYRNHFLSKISKKNFFQSF